MESPLGGSSGGGGGGGLTSPLTTKGDLWGYSTLDARVPVGADGQVLLAASAQALGVSWSYVLRGPSAPLSPRVDWSGNDLVLSGDYDGNGPTGGVIIQSPTPDIGENSGSITLIIGEPDGASRGKIKFQNGSQGTVGHVWTQTDADGSGSWQAAGGGGASTALDNLGAVSINADMNPDGNGSRNWGSAGARWGNGYVNALRDGGNVPYLTNTREMWNASGDLMLDFSGSVINFQGRELSNIADPTSAQNAATKAYADSKGEVFEKMSVLFSDINGAAVGSTTISLARPLAVGEAIREILIDLTTLFAGTGDTYEKPTRIRIKVGTTEVPQLIPITGNMCGTTWAEQSIEINGEPVSGSFKISDGINTSAAIQWDDINQASLQAAIRSIAGYEDANVSADGSRVRFTNIAATPDVLQVVENDMVDTNTDPVNVNFNGELDYFPFLGIPVDIQPTTITFASDLTITFETQDGSTLDQLTAGALDVYAKISTLANLV